MTEPTAGGLPIAGPDQGHTFRITMSSRGSYGVTGVVGHTDAVDFSEPVGVEVRAWNLRDALRKAAELPLSAWFPESLIDPETGQVGR